MRGFGLLFIGFFFVAFTDLGAMASAEVQLEVKLLRDVPQVGENAMKLSLMDAAGKKIEQAKINVELYMPEMGSMPRMEEKAVVKELGGGGYEASFQLSMGGSWEIDIKVERGPTAEVFHYSLTTDIPGIADKNVKLDQKEQGELPENTLKIGVQRLQLIGVRFAEAQMTNLQRMIRTVGVVEQDRARREEVTLRFSGYVAQLFAVRVGDKVSKGQPLFTIYSPDLVTAQSEYLLAAKSQGNTKALLAATEDRLRNLGLSNEQIQALQKAGKPQRDIMVRTPIQGTILELAVSEGGSVTAGQTAAIIGDLDQGYLVAKVFQQDLGNIKLGQAAEFTISNISTEPQKGRVDLIYPQVEQGTGTANVRIRTDQFSADLKPGVYADVRFAIAIGSRLAIPVDALLYSGLHNYVFIDRGQGMLEPREVFPGQFVGDLVEIRSGLKAGERVAASGTFLLSSEAQLRSALPKWTAQSR